MFYVMYMVRTTLLIPPSLKQAAEKVAKKQGISLGELIRVQLRKVVHERDADQQDPIYSRFRVFDGIGPSDLSENHDDYLYGS